MNKKILLGVTGSVAAYKALEITRILIKNGAEVKVIMTKSALEFVQPLSFSSLSQRPVYTQSFPKDFSWNLQHIELAKWADVFLIAPATANIIAKINHGIADDLLSTVCLATTAPICIAPAMNKEMWNNVVTQNNVTELISKGVKFIGPDKGIQACGDIGYGRMLEPYDIVSGLTKTFYPQLFLDKRIIVTAGPTVEPIDSVRFISNYSSGKMGYAIAEAAKHYGANVTLVSGPTNIKSPHGVKTVAVNTAQEMLAAVMQEVNDHGCDIFIGAAAVADYRAANICEHKIKKTTDETITIEFVKNPDILQAISSLTKRPLVIGFAAETKNLLENAKEKLLVKNLDAIAANIVGKNIGFNVDDNALTIITKSGINVDLIKQNKQLLAYEFMQFIFRTFFADS